MPEVDVFLIGTPKSGTTWLAHTLNQHTKIDLSDPKEPNIIASHRGTFIRTDESPEWNKFKVCFRGEGLKLDASIHAFSCPLAPSRIRQRIPNAKFILCLREPVARAFSHWNMVLNTKESEANGVDWSTFEKAWEDDRLSDDSRYGTSMTNWLKEFDSANFLILDSAELKEKPLDTLIKIEEFLELENHKFEISLSKHSNSASSRRFVNSTGKLTRSLFSIIPKSVKRPIVGMLQKRDINIYNFPLISSKEITNKIDSSDFKICGDQLIEELELFESLTEFDTSHWRDEIQQNMSS